MKHAGDGALDELAGLLDAIRALPELTEKKRGVFYRKSGAFLHFHEDAAGLFADVKGADGWRRFGANDAREWDALLAEIRYIVTG